MKVEGDVLDAEIETSTLPFRPLGARVVIRADREDRSPETLDSGLVVAKTLAAAVEGSDVEDSWFVGTVVGLGPEQSSDPIHVGDRVIFSWAAGQQLTIDGEKYLILHHTEVLGVLE
jgi:co-chaperonin GroES (HSP10)